MNKLEELAERLERATGPSLELDNAIRDLAGEPRDNGLSTPHYSASIDAAMSLLDGLQCCAATVNWCPYGSSIAEVYLGNPGPMFGAEAATPALALAAASLRARSMKEGSHGEG